MQTRKAASQKRNRLRLRQPRSSRPDLPPDYRLLRSRKGLLAWPYVHDRMVRSRNYWIGTTRPDGAPHVMPVWGVWLDNTLYFGTDRASRKARNLARSPAAVAHLESGDEAVILEGIASEVREASLLQQIDKAYFAKYKMRLIGYPADLVIYALNPRVVFGWREKNFVKSATRWTITK